MTMTNLVLANSSNSLRTTVPSHIVKQFKLKAGDKMDWTFMVEGNKLIIIITPVTEV